SDKAQPRDAPAFLIDCDDRLDVAQVAQIINQLSELRGAFDVASEEDERPWLHAPKQARCFGIEFFTRHTGHDQLTKRIGLHGAQRWTLHAQYSTPTAQFEHC